MSKACSNQKHYLCNADEAKMIATGYPADFIANVKCDCNCHL